MAGIKLNLRNGIRVKDKSREFGAIKGKGTDGTPFTWQIPVLITVDASLGQTVDLYLGLFQTDLRIDWGDGTVENVVSAGSDVYHTYPSPSSTYQIHITGVNLTGRFSVNVNTASNSQNNVVSIDNYYYGGKDVVSECESTSLLSLPNYLPVTVRSLRYIMRFSTANVTGPENWDTSNLTLCFDAFRDASGFNRDISSWDVSKVTLMTNMFNGASSFNQDISSWNVSGVTSMGSMFEGASSFNQDLSSWDISNVSNMFKMFDGSGLSTENYSRILIGWANAHFAGNARDDVFLGASGITYNNTAYTTGNQFNDAVSARSYLVNTAGWTITDGGQV